MRKLFASLLLLGLLIQSVWAVCSPADTAEYLTLGTSYVLTPKQVDYVIVIDKSGSMQGAKLEKVKQAVKVLVQQLPANERAALVSFNYNATIHQKLTNNHDELFASVDAMKAEFGTQYAPPLIAAAEIFKSANPDRALIFLSDGKGDFGEEPELIESLTETISKQGACILTVSYALGGDESPLLKTMAEIGERNGCGQHFTASEQGTELEQVFSTIHETLSATELVDIKPQSVANGSYDFAYTSSLNDLPLPGVAQGKCADTPQLSMSIYRGGRLVTTAGPQSSGTVALPAGDYTYKATAALRCDGACSYTGRTNGSFRVEGICDPTYTDLATYVTGETQQVRITDAGFEPSAVSGRQGTVVLWTNTDVVPRRLMSPYFDENIPPGNTFSYVIGGVGTLLYSDPERNISGNVQPIKGIGTDVLLIIDESGSMKGEGILEARAAAQQFFALLSPEDRGALITFSQDANIVQEFTSDSAALQLAAQKLVSKGPTNYLSALAAAHEQRTTQKGVVVFMSDGVPTDPEGEDAILASVAALRDKGWCIMTVGFGKESKQAEDLLSGMAGNDQCSAFLYASSGTLAQTFGTIYQLAHAQNDLTFVNTRIPLITLDRGVKLSTGLKTKTGKPVPGGEDTCSPAATIQATTTGQSTLLVYDDQQYAGNLQVQNVVNRVKLVAGVASTEQPGRTFVGSTQHTIIYIPWWAICLCAAAAIGILLYKRTRHSGA